MFQGCSRATKTGCTRDHPANSCFFFFFCFSATVGSRAPLKREWQQDRVEQIEAHGSLDVGSGAYITWWANRSVRVGPDWCKRVSGQAAISCPQISGAGLSVAQPFFLFSFCPCNVSQGPSSASALTFSHILSSVSLSPRRDHIGELAQELLNVLPFLMGLQGPWLAHAQTHKNEQRWRVQ